MLYNNFLSTLIKLLNIRNATFLFFLLLVMTSFNHLTFIPVDINPLDSRFNFNDVFLIDFDNILLSQHGGNSLINSQQLYLSSKNKYIQYTLENSNTFINLQHTLTSFNIDKYNFNSTTSSHVKHRMKTIFKHQLIAFQHFLTYIEFTLTIQAN
jgi:hypothetical protein